MSLNRTGPAFSVVFVILLCCALAPSLLAAQAVTGTITGNTRDQSGAAIPGVTVSLLNPSTGFNTSTVSDETGSFRFLSIAASSGYEIRAELPGFRTIVVADILVRPGGSQRFDVAMEVATVAEQVTVTADAPLINIDSAAISEGIGAALAQALPLSRREFGELAVVFQGMQYNPSDNTTYFVQTHSRGLPTSGTAYRVDGVASNYLMNQAAGLRLPMGAIDQYEVTQGGFSAEYGENAGAVVSVTTKSGANELFFTYNTLVKPKSLNSSIKSGLANQVNDKASSSTHFEEFAIGGAIVKDRLFFFNSFQYQNLFTGNLVAPKTLNSMYYGNVLKITFNRTPVDRWDYGITFTPGNQWDAGWTDPVISLESEYLRRAMISSSQLKNTRTFGNRVVLESAANYFNINVYNAPQARIYHPKGRYTKPLKTQDAVTVFTRQGNYSTGPYSTYGGSASGRFRLSEKVGFQTNKLNVRVGVDYSWIFGEQYNREVARSLTDRRPIGSTLTYTQNIYGRPDLGTKDGAVYLQTGWRISPSILLDLGVRADGMTAVEGVMRNVAPRAGLTIDPSGTGRSRIYANWGLFYQYLPLSNLAFGKATIEQRLYRIDNADANYNGTLVLQNIFRQIRNPNARPPVVNSWSMGYEFMLPAKIKLGASYAGNRQHHQTTSLRSATEDYQNDDGRGSYRALEINWRRAFSNGLELTGNYTRSRTLADTGSSVTQLQLPFRYGYQNWHEPNALNLIALIRMKGFTISPKYNYHSGRPYSINSPTVGTAVQYVDLQGNPAGRNIYSMPSNTGFDLTLSRGFSFETFHIAPTVEILNVMNKVNIFAVSPVLANAGQATNVGDSRQIQMGLEINFGRD